MESKALSSQSDDPVLRTSVDNALVPLDVWPIGMGHHHFLWEPLAGINSVWVGTGFMYFAPLPSFNESLLSLLVTSRLRDRMARKNMIKTNRSLGVSRKR